MSASPLFWPIPCSYDCGRWVLEPGRFSIAFFENAQTLP